MKSQRGTYRVMQVAKVGKYARFHVVFRSLENERDVNVNSAAKYLLLLIKPTTFVYVDST